MLGDAEIGDFDRFVDRHEEIAGLNVFMNHILTVEILCEGNKDGIQLGVPHAVRCVPLRGAWQELHHEKVSDVI